MIQAYTHSRVSMKMTFYMAIKNDVPTKMMNLVYDNIDKLFQDKTIAPKWVLEVIDKNPIVSDKQSLRNRGMQIGKILKASQIFIGNVWRYRDREYDKLGIKNPASVAFAIYLIDVETGVTLWRDTFDETQTPLTENLFKVKDFLRQGGKWLSADELAQVGVKHLLNKFSKQKLYIDSFH